MSRWLADDAPGPEEVRLARELHDEVLGAIQRLSVPNREAVIGYYLQGYSQAELAELLGVPVGTVKGRLHKSREQLRPLTRAYGDSDVRNQQEGEKDGWRRAVG